MLEINLIDTYCFFYRYKVSYNHQNQNNMHYKQQTNISPADLLSQNEDLRRKIAELERAVENKDKSIQDLECVRLQLLNVNATDSVTIANLKLRLRNMETDWKVDQAELKKLIKENSKLQDESGTTAVLSNLLNSGAFVSEPVEDLNWKEISDNRMTEIKRKEDVIQQKDMKATRLIEIIRGKNKQIKYLREIFKKVQSEKNFMFGSLGMVSEVVNNQATLVYHPEAAEAATRRFNTPPGLSPPGAPKVGNKTWESWIARRFNQSN